MSNILQELESSIAGLKSSVSTSNIGVVREIGDGAARRPHRRADGAQHLLQRERADRQDS